MFRRLVSGVWITSGCAVTRTGITNNDSATIHRTFFMPYSPSDQRWSPIWRGEITINAALLMSIATAHLKRA
jgi:hypothetical protein